MSDSKLVVCEIDDGFIINEKIVPECVVRKAWFCDKCGIIKHTISSDEFENNMCSWCKVDLEQVFVRKKGCEPVILDNNPISIAKYVAKYPENWEKMKNKILKVKE